MIHAIVAINMVNGIGRDNTIPWKCSSDLNIFRSKTMNKIVIVGRKTAESLPKLEGRIVLCISKSGSLEQDKNNCRIFNSIEHAINFSKENYPDFEIFICGGASIYSQSWKYIDMLHVSWIYNDIECDSYLSLNLENMYIKSVEEYPDFKHVVYSKNIYGERGYLNLLQRVLENGEVRQGRNGETRSIFGENIRFDLRTGYPLLTTKKMFWKGIVEELLFFIKGDTDTKKLEHNGVNIWKGNTDHVFLSKNGKRHYREGLMGPMYGYQWRFFNAKYNCENGKPENEGLDQLRILIDNIKKDKYSRRHIITDYNPLQSDEGVLFPCHSLILQFYVSDNYLDMSCYNRSQDMFLGVPFNIASSALLLSIIAKLTGLEPRFLIMNLGDCHIYNQHYEAVNTQISRTPYVFPKLIVPEIKDLQDLENLSFRDFIIKDYNFYPPIKAEMIA